MIEKIEPPEGDGNFVVRKFILHNKIIEKIETPEGDGNWEAISKYIIIIH